MTRLSGSLLAIAATIAISESKSSNAFRSIGGREAAVQILAEAAKKLAEYENAEGGAKT